MAFFGRGWSVCLPACFLAGLILTVIALDPVTSDARSRAKCAGVRATHVSNRSHIVAKPRAVVVARGKRRHKITVAPGDDSRHIICGGSGKDVIEGGRGDDILVGGPGKDRIDGGRGSDLVVGDIYNRRGNAIGKAASDVLYGGKGNEVIVGDNLASGDATGGKRDQIGGNIGGETIVGDSAVTGRGTAKGGADDWAAGMQGDDLVIGDSFSPRGRAIGGGDDILDHALESVLMIGDSATLTGTAIGGGHDRMHGSTGGDYHQRCRRCDNRMYGDSYALTRNGADRGRGNDLLTAGLGDDTYLDGQGSHPAGGGRGKDLCAGNKHGRNVGVACAVYKRIQHVRSAPAPPPSMRQLKRRYGAWWPFRTGSPRP